jgi:CxxC motif-containing protein
MNTSEQRISCIVCPMSCEGIVTFKNGEIKEISGFTCQRGLNYAREEVIAPKRTLTTTIRITSGELPLLPVISKTALPKDKVIACARCLSTVIVAAPIHEGDVVLSNILNLGVDIIATRDILKRAQ